MSYEARVNVLNHFDTPDNYECFILAVRHNKCIVCTTEQNYAIVTVDDTANVIKVETFDGVPFEVVAKKFITE